MINPMSISNYSLVLLPSFPIICDPRISSVPAMIFMVVDSPPGITKASQRSNSWILRTWICWTVRRVESFSQLQIIICVFFWLPKWSRKGTLVVWYKHVVVEISTYFCLTRFFRIPRRITWLFVFNSCHPRSSHQNATWITRKRSIRCWGNFLNIASSGGSLCCFIKIVNSPGSFLLIFCCLAFFLNNQTKNVLFHGFFPHFFRGGLEPTWL